MNWTSERIAYQRQQEAINGAAVVGVKAADVVLLVPAPSPSSFQCICLNCWKLQDYEDGMLTSYPEVEVREQVVSVIRQYQPHVVLTWFGYRAFSLLPAEGWDDLNNFHFFLLLFFPYRIPSRSSMHWPNSARCCLYECH